MDRHATVRILVAALALAGALGLASQPAVAHETVTVGEYELLVGWREEPAIAGFLNGLDLGIRNGTGAPVLGAEATLNATISNGPASAAKGLEPQVGRDGWYTFDVIPTRLSGYSVRIFGTLGTTAVNVSVALDDVSPASDLAFPDPDPTARDLQGQIKAADASIAALQSQVAAALGIAVLGIIAGGVGIAFAWRASRGPRKAQTP